MPDFELLDITYSTAGDDEARPKVGDQTSGIGVGQDCAFFGTDGFVSIPNPPDGSGGCAQAVAMTIGNDRCVIGSLDGRYNDKAGSLAPGDRAIVSNCDARLLLDQSANTIGLFTTGVSVVGDGASQSLMASAGAGAMQVRLVPGGPDVISISLAQGAVAASVSIGGNALILSYSAGAVLASVTLGPGGTVDIIAPGGVTINGIPLVVP